jgi:hypothetical protein
MTSASDAACGPPLVDTSLDEPGLSQREQGENHGVTKESKKRNIEGVKHVSTQGEVRQGEEEE